MTWPTPVEWVSISVEFAVTVTCSLTVPTASVTLICGFVLDLQDDAVLDVGGEALKDDLQLIGSDGQVWKDVAAVARR